MKQQNNRLIPYRLLICTDGCGIAFEQELIAYTFGILDKLSMELVRAENEMCMFWREILGVIPEGMPGDYDEICRHPFMKDLTELYLLETNDLDDENYGYRFYGTHPALDDPAKTLPAGTTHVTQVQFISIPHPDYEYRLFPRIYKFFEIFRETYAKKVNLTGLWLVDSHGKKVKEYRFNETGNH